MTPWIQVYSNLTSHRKTGRLADALGLANSFVSPNVVAVGILVSLWTWAVQNASDGDLSGCSARAIAEACRWNKKPDALVSALMDSGWIDPDKKLHDWEEYVLLLMEKEDNRKAKTRERVQRYREKQKEEKKPSDERYETPEIDEDVTPCNGYRYVSDTPCNAPTITIPYHNHTIPEDNNSIYLSEERKKEIKKERSAEAPDPWKNADTWIKMAKTAKEAGWANLDLYIARARECGAIIDPETMEVTYLDR